MSFSGKHCRQHIARLAVFALAVLGSGCAVLDGAVMAIEQGAYTKVHPKGEAVKFEQRYDSEYLGSGKNLLVSTAPNVFIRPYYRLIDAPFDTYGALDVTAYYDCPNYQEDFSDSFTLRKGEHEEVKGKSFRLGSCAGRVVRYQYSLSKEPYNTRFEDATGHVYVGIFSEGAFKQGMTQYPDKILFVEKDENFQQQGWQKALTNDGLWVASYYQNGVADGLSYRWREQEPLTVSHYSQGQEDTYDYYMGEAKRATKQQHLDKGDYLVRKVNIHIADLQASIAQQDGIIESEAYKAEQNKLRKYGKAIKDLFYDCRPASYMPIPDDFDMRTQPSQYAYVETWRRQQVQEAADCQAMVDMGKRLQVPMSVAANELEHYLVHKADLKHLSGQRYIHLRAGIEAQRKLMALSPQIAKAKADKAKIEKAHARDYRLSYAKKVQTKYDQLMAQDKRQAQQFRAKHEAQQACLRAHGFGKYRSWEYMPVNHACMQDQVLLSKY